MRADVITDANGKELQRADHNPDGERVGERTAIRAALVGAIQLLDDVARMDENPRFRAEARKMSDGLKSILRPKSNTRTDIVDAVHEARHALPEPQRRLGNDDVVDI